MITFYLGKTSIKIQYNPKVQPITIISNQIFSNAHESRPRICSSGVLYTEIIFYIVESTHLLRHQTPQSILFQSPKISVFIGRIMFDKLPATHANDVKTKRNQTEGYIILFATLRFTIKSYQIYHHPRAHSTIPIIFSVEFINLRLKHLIISSIRVSLRVGGRGLVLENNIADMINYAKINQRE